MEKVLEKVTAFITRKNKGETQLLLFCHPHAGIQVPAGTIKDYEGHMEAALREAKEETGLDNLKVKNYIGFMDKLLPNDQFVVVKKTKVYSRPNINSFNWAEFRKGITITSKNRQNKNFIHTVYNEWDNISNTSYISYSILGWVPCDCLSKKVRRYFYHLEVQNETFDVWDKFADNHVFKLFWANISKLPSIVSPQNEWIDYTIKNLKYIFD